MYYLAIDGVAKSIDHTAKQTFASGDIDDSTSTLHNVTLTNQLVITENDNTNVIGFQVQSHTLKRQREREREGLCKIDK